MPEEFRHCFVGDKGYDAVKKLMKNGNEFCLEVAKCLQDRNDAETAYVRALRKNGAALEKLAGRANGTLGQAFIKFSNQTNQEANAHSLIADKLLNEISIPMRNLAEAQAKERKLIEEGLYGKYKEWNSRKEIDNKYRLRQFEKCREIESLYGKISEASSGSKSSSRSKTSSVSTPMVLSCVLPASRYSSVSEKSSSHVDTKYQANLESTMKKTEEELERTEDKYHLATRNVEIYRQIFDAEMCRGCDELQKMEFNRLTEMSNYLRTYVTAIQTLSQTMNQVTQDLYTIKVDPDNDILVHVKSYNQPTEIEILLYDIYAENEDNTMSEQRRILSLQNWMERLRKDVDIQRQIRNANRSDSPDDDRGSSSDGAMCSKKDIVQNDESPPSNDDDDDDDDGGMYRRKERKEVSNGVSSEKFVDRQGAALLEELYRASLYKIECVYNRIKGFPKPNYEYSDLITRTYTDKSIPTTLLRLPFQSFTRTPPSAPPAVQYFAEMMPIYGAPVKLASAPKQGPPPPGWDVSNFRSDRSTQAPYPTYDQMARMQPVLLAQAPPIPTKHVRALYEYKAKHDDELDLQPGQIIVLMDRRDDGWYQGNLHGKIGLFPGNFVTDA